MKEGARSTAVDDIFAAMIGSRIGPYRVLRPLGEGGMGAVFEAMHDPLARRVAIKVLRAQFIDKPEVLARFFNEARAVNVIEHPGLVPVSDCGQLGDGSPYLVMELLRGETLLARMRRERPLPLEIALGIAEQLASILAAAHAGGIVHRDLKPANVMLLPDPALRSGLRVRLLDFGIAKMASGLGDGSPLTRTGVIMGTPRYMAPEQCQGAGSVDGRADVYALGVVLFEMLAGRPLFSAENELAMLLQHLHAAVPRLDALEPPAQSIPPAIVELVARMLSKDRQERPDLAEIVSRCTSPHSDSTRLSSGPAASTLLVGEARLARRRLRPMTAVFLAVSTLVAILGLFYVQRQRVRPPVRAAVPSEPPAIVSPPPAAPSPVAPSPPAAAPSPAPSPLPVASVDAALRKSDSTVPKAPPAPVRRKKPPAPPIEAPVEDRYVD